MVESGTNRFRIVLMLRATDGADWWEANEWPHVIGPYRMMPSSDWLFLGLFQSRLIVTVIACDVM